MPETDIGLNIDTLILPGLYGSGEGHWQWHWARDHAGARIVGQENWDCPDLESWRLRLNKALAAVDGVWIVAHSLGCILTANLVGNPLASRVKGAVLVAPCDLAAVERLHPCVVNFGAMPCEELPFPSLVVGSLNDPYMDFDTTRRMADLWGSDLIDLGHAGHINIRSGYGRWPGGYRLPEALRNAAARPAGISRMKPARAADAVASHQ